MKQLKILVLTVVITFSAFAAVIYSSCKKATCSGVVCQNGGSCSKGSCSCPAGYSGNLCQLSSILFQNNTFTQVSLSVNGAPSTLAIGGSVVYAGATGSVVTVAATTAGSSSSGVQYGSTISWSFTDTLPSGGAGFTQPFNVSPPWFYLQLINDDAAQYITSLYVNYGSPLQTMETVSVPNDRNTYGIGYYRDSTNTQIYALSGAAQTWTWNPSVPNTINATVVLKAN